MNVRDLDDYIRHIENNINPLFIKNLAKEMQEKDKEIDRLNNIINEFDDFITNVDSHINLGDESEEFILVRDKWLELQELKGSEKE